jgi:transcription antitermination factor NusG
MHLTVNDTKAHGLGDAPQWHALYTRHQHEKPVARMLSSKGHEVFLPLYAVARRWQDRRKNLSLLLFPCYVFIRGGLDRQHQILSTPGVFTVVGWAGHPAAIPESQIQGLRQMAENSTRLEPHPYLLCGDRVRIRSGTLQGLEGILVRKKNISRLVVSLEILGRSAAVEVDASCLETLDRAPGALGETT